MTRQSGISAEIFTPYQFADMPWADSTNQIFDPYYVHLASKVAVQSNGDFYVKDKDSGYWNYYAGRALALNAAANCWCGTFTAANGQTCHVGRDKIAEFINKAILPIQGIIFLPMCSDFIIYENQKYLNVWCDTLAPPNGDAINDIEGFLNLVRQSVCNKPGHKTIEELTDIVMGNDPTELEFRFLLHWVAAIYQRPGINLQTNIFLLGSAKGIGKGTFVRVLKLIFGTSLGKVNCGDLERHWNNFLEGKLIVEADEFSGSTKIDFNQMLKRDSTNSIISISKRNTTPRDVPNCSNWLITTNQEEPLPMETTDRRNFYIATTNDAPTWEPKARAINNRLNIDKGYRAALTGGLAWLLDSIVVDANLISIAPDTPLRADNRISSENAVVRWLTEDDKYQRDAWTDATELFRQYDEWRNVYAKPSKIIALGQWGREMTRLHRQGTVRKEDKPGYRARYCVPTECFPTLKSADKTNVADLNAVRRRLFEKE